MAARAAAWRPSASCVSAPTLRASSMWPETASTESSTSRIRRSRASSAFCDASWKLSRAARSRPRSRKSAPRFHASSARATDAPRFAASRIASLVPARCSRTRSASRAWADSDARTRSWSSFSSTGGPWTNASRARSKSLRAATASESAESHGSNSPCAARTAYDHDARRSWSVVRSAILEASWAALRAASNRRSWNRLRAWTSNSSTLAKSKDESRPRSAAARWSVGGAASTSIRISAASGAPARASTRSALFFRPCRLTRCRSPISRSWRGFKRLRRCSIRRRSASARIASPSGRAMIVSISRARSAWRPRCPSSAGRTRGGPRRSRRTRGRLRCCSVCGPGRVRFPPGGRVRRRSRRSDRPRRRIDRRGDGLSGRRRQRLFSAAVFASFVSFRSGPSVFKDQGKLSFDYLPDKLVHRDQQTQRLFSLLRPIVEAGASSNAFLYGAVGTGKTHTAKRFCLDFRKYASEPNRAVDWDLVNCRQRMGDDAVLLRLLQHFDAHFPERGFSIAEKMESLRKHLEKHRLHFIVILDEVDALLKKSGADLIYSFARIAEEGTTTKGNISMILISQRPNALDYMDAAALSTFRRTNVVEFPRYDRQELEDIVHVRVALAMHPGTVDDDLVDLIADIASEFGDARYGIELLEKAGMLADEEHAEEVAAEHVRGAKAQVHPIEVEERLALLDVPKKLVLLSIARKSRKKAYITMGDAEQAYALVCEEYGEKPRAHTQFWKYVKELDALGLVDTKLSGKGEVGKTTLISLPEVPARVLADNLERSLKRR